MSFNDIALDAQGGRPRVDINRRGDGLQMLSMSLQKYNASANALKQFVASSLKPGSTTSRTDLEAKLRLCRDYESNVKVHLTSQVKRLSTEPKTTVAPMRLAVSKLQKDFDRVRQVVATLTADAERKLSAPAGGNGAPQAIGASASSSSVGGGAYEGGGRGVSSDSTGPRITQKLQGAEVDEAIAQEREQDIFKINQDLKLVNEMFKGTHRHTHTHTHTHTSSFPRSLSYATRPHTSTSNKRCRAARRRAERPDRADCGADQG